MQATLSGVDPRLQQRYEILVQEHTGQAHPTAPGPRILPGTARAKAHARNPPPWMYTTRGVGRSDSAFHRSSTLRPCGP